MKTELHLFRDGPQHNQVWSTHQLLYKCDELPDAAAWITQYKWTDETVVGSESGRVARVWVHLDSLL